MNKKRKKNPNIKKYITSIKVQDPNKCAQIDPFGLCTVDDCMDCSNSRVTIKRISDGCIMRKDNLVNTRSIARGMRIEQSIIEKCQKDPILFIERYCKVNLTSYEKLWILHILKKRGFEKPHENKK